MTVLIISQDWAIQNVVSQLGIICGYPLIMTETVPEAQAKLAQLGSEAWVLIVIDTGVFGEAGTGTQSEVHQLLRTWSVQYLGLPVVCLGNVLQKYTLLADHPACVPFVTLPFSPHDLMQTMQSLLPNGGGLRPIPFPPMRPPKQIPGHHTVQNPPPGGRILRVDDHGTWAVHPIC